MSKFGFCWGLSIELRDGVRLNATLYLPIPKGSATRCIVLLTPYVADTYHERGAYFASHGFAFLIVDVRGRGNSQGTFRPSIQEAKDGYDVIEWVAQQPFCDGRVAMWGGSYGGYCQWATAKEFPPHLTTIVPVAAPYYGVDFPMRNNIFHLYCIQWLTLVSGRAIQNQIAGDEAFWAARYQEWFESGRSLREIDALLGHPSAQFQEWLSHPMPDEYWDAHNPTAADYARLRIPILTITGCFDGDQPGALEHYRQHMRHGTPESCASHYLIIGPWDHAGTRTPKTEFAGVRVGSASLLDLPLLHRQWYEWTMQGKPKPPFLEKNVAYYVMGAEKWRYADTLAGVTSHSSSFFLASSGSACDVFHSGSLTPEAPNVSSPDSYVYDPRDTTLAKLESTIDLAARTEQRLTYAGVSKILVYHSEPFVQDLEITGFFQLSAWISIDQPDTDFGVWVYEVALDGSVLLLSTDSLRARHRNGPREEVLMRSREPLLYEFRNFTFVSRRILRRHRLRLVFGPVNSIYSQKNYNSGRAVADESVDDAQTVTVTLYHDPQHPSALHVPFGWPDDSQ